MAKMVILRAFDIKIVASRIYALLTEVLSVIRQQMSPFYPGGGGGGIAQSGQCPLFPVFFKGELP